MKFKLVTIIVFLLPYICIAQQQFTISGYVTDKNSGEALIGATVYDKSTYMGASTNDYGFYSITLPKGKYDLVFSHNGYSDNSIELSLSENHVINLFLTEKTFKINEVRIKSDKHENPLRTNEFSKQKLTIETIKQLPNIFGEADLIKAVQLQPGVKTLGDGSSGMFVRGGSSDQNLIIIDEAPIYNPSHMLGLISVFNPDAINSVTLYKSNMPAQYGGRVSAVLDCKMKEGSLYKYNFSAGISPMSISVYADGPIVKEKSAFLLSVRKSLLDLLFSPEADGIFEMVPNFYDLNVKMNTKLGKKDRLFLSFYNGKDRNLSFDGFDNQWGNLSNTFRWNRCFSQKWFSNLSFIYSKYSNNLKYNEGGKGYKWRTGVEDFNGKLDLSYFISTNNTVKLGINSIYHKFISGETADTLQSIPRIQAFESAFYILHDTKLFKWLSFNYGVRVSLFQNSGKALWYDYDATYIPIQCNTNNTGIYNTSLYIEPRVNINLTLKPKYSLKIAYTRNTQYMQVLQNSTLSYSALETWFPVNPNIEPVLVDVFSAGWFQEIGKPYFISAEVYYKDIKNQIDYIDHAKLTDNPYIESEVRKGTAKAYGCEIELKKRDGKLTGSLSYSYSRAFRKIEGINNDKEYSSPYDIPHDFRFTTNYAFNKKWSISSFWIFTSGRPVTIPNGFYQEGHYDVPIYSDRNSAHFPNYHRLDFSINYTTKFNGKKSYYDIALGVYNLYGKENPIGYEYTGTTLDPQTFIGFMPNFSVKAYF